MDPRSVNGGVFLGLNGVVVKSHGSSDALGFASAIDLAIDMAQSDVVARISADRTGIVAQTARERRTATRHDRRREKGGDLVTVMRSQVLGCGAYLPGKVLSNDDIAKLVDTSDEWVVERTGIRRRHVVSEGETTSDLAYAARCRRWSAPALPRARSTSSSSPPRRPITPFPRSRRAFRRGSA